jgi:hypothetical protein
MAQSAGGSQLTSGMGMNEQTGQQYGQQPTTNMGMQMPYGQPPKAFGSNGYTMPSTGGGQFGLPGAAGTPTPMANPYAQTTGGYQGMPSTGGGQFGLPSAGGAPAQYGGSGAIASGGYGPTGGGQFGLPGAGGTPLDYPPPVTQPPIGSVQAGGNPYPGQQQQAPVADWQAQYGQLSNQQAQQMSEQANNARNLAAIGQYRNITAGDNGTYYGTDYYGQRQQLTGNQAMTSGSASANDLYQQQLNYADQTRRMGQMLRQSQSRYLGGYDPNMLRGNLAGYG